MSIERVIEVSPQEFHRFDNTDEPVILVGRDSSGTPSNVPSQRQSPSNFPIPPAGGQPSQSVYILKYHTAPRVVTGPGLGAGSNPAGAGRGDVKRPVAFYDNKEPIPQDMLDYLARELGAKSILQKKGSEICLHILDLKDLLPHQKESYKANFLQAAREEDQELTKHIIVQND